MSILRKGSLQGTRCCCKLNAKERSQRRQHTGKDGVGSVVHRTGPCRQEPSRSERTGVGQWVRPLPAEKNKNQNPIYDMLWSTEREKETDPPGGGSKSINTLHGRPPPPFLLTPSEIGGGIDPHSQKNRGKFRKNPGWP